MSSQDYGGADSRRSRTRAPIPQLQSSSRWVNGAVFQHRNVKVTCKVVQDHRYWATKGYLHGSPDHAMDRIEGRL